MCYFTCPFTTPNSNSHSQQKALPKSAILSLLLTKSVSIYKGINRLHILYLCEKSFLSVLSIKLQYFKGYCGAGFGVGEGVVVVC